MLVILWFLSLKKLTKVTGFSLDGIPVRVVLVLRHSEVVQLLEDGGARADVVGAVKQLVHGLDRFAVQRKNATNSVGKRDLQFRCFKFKFFEYFLFVPFGYLYLFSSM